MLHPLPNQAFRKDKKFNKFALALTMISFVLIVWQELGMNLQYRIPQAAFSKTIALNDDVNGGLSRSKLKTSNGNSSLTCETVQSDTFSFCSVLIPVNERLGQGVDLSRYDQLSITLSYQEKEQLRDTILIYLLNDEGLPKSRNTFESMRANQAAIIPNLGNKSSYQLPLSQFSVPSWWMYHHPELKQHSATFDNVKYIQIATGDSFIAKNVTIEIEDIAFSGKWISKLDLYRFIVIVWLSSAILYGITIAHRHIRTLTQSAQRLHSEKQNYLKLAQYDHLTKALNRRGLDHLCRNLGSGCSVILFDVDNFKSVNDQYGHDEGDRILVEIVEYTSTNIEKNCHLARWGGEEFIVICEQTTGTQAYAIAERLRGLIEQKIHLIDGQSLTCTFGIAEVVQSQDQAIKQADVALLQGKNSGKNCVILSQ
ncbi:GGDEF domain-containing protein [Vibrio hippocampi]|uniref:diguanylate cyclase n=1 Tax=Vibrio hippocampi TaxID=654686 RepID=A0ABM8ZN97_9VIBR|nr:GGDEF domain-containing protein [Vibrio hippocampi]CAH0529940.1 hypothetical protein VHP8226_03677 [Vibrio hippocampi]